MSGSPLIVVAWRTDGFWILLWLRIWFSLTSGRSRSVPPRGFVGTASGSSRATGLQGYKLLSTRLRRDRSTRDAPLWRLTCEWGASPPPSQKLKPGFG